MGNALWRGIRVRDLLQKTGIKPEALEVVFGGGESGPVTQTPRFQKSLPLQKALDPKTLIAFEMNGQALPRQQGYPARLIVPGWAGTYWIQNLTTIEVIAHPFDGFWMKKAYRIPKDKFKSIEAEFPSQTNSETKPITELIVNSMVTNLEEGQTIELESPTPLRGVAWDSGHGIQKVEISDDDGTSWMSAHLEKDFGPFSWRQFSFTFTPKKPGSITLMVKATNNAGDTQPRMAVSKGPGYHNYAIQSLKVTVGPHPQNARIPSPSPTASAWPESELSHRCSICHSLDYLQMHTSILDRKGWEKEVLKMKNDFKAPIQDSEVPTFIDLLDEVSHSKAHVQ